MLRKFEIIVFVAATAVVVAITIGATSRERTAAGNHPIASRNRIDPGTLQLKVDIFNLQRTTVDLPY